MATEPSAPSGPIAFDPDALAASYREDVASSLPAETAEAPPAPDPPVGSNPPGEAVTSEAPPPDAPAAQPAPSETPAAATDADLQHALELAGAKDVPEAERAAALAKTVREWNTRLAEQAKELKALKGTTPQAPAPEVPAPAQTVTAQPEQAPPPAQPAPVPADVEAEIEKQATEVEQSDQTYRAYASQYDVTIQKLATIVDRDPAQPNNPEAFVGALPKLDAEIVALDAEIASVTATLNPPASIKALVPPMDPMDAQRLQDSLDRLSFQRDRKEAQRHNLTITANNLRQARNTADANMKGRAKEIRDHFRGQYDEHRQKEERDRNIATAAEGYKTQFTQTFEGAFAKSGVKPSQKDRIFKTLRVEAWRNTDVFDDLSSFLEAGIKAEAESLDAYHREQMAEYGRMKKDDAAQQAPPASQAGIPTSPVESVDWEERSLEGYRADLRNSQAPRR